MLPGCYFETVASNLGQSLNLVHQANNVGQMTCLYIETKTRTPDRNRQKAESLSFCKQVLQMEEDDIIVLTNEELLCKYLFTVRYKINYNFSGRVPSRRMGRVATNEPVQVFRP